MKPDWNVHLVETVGEAEAFLTWLSQRRPVLAYDTETTGLHPWGEDCIRMAQFGDGQDGWAIDTSEWKGVVRQALGSYTGPVVGHNMSFDRGFTEAAGLPWFPVSQVHDTMVMAHLLNPARALGLKPLGERLVPGASAAQYDLRQGMTANGWNWATVPTTFKPYWVYAASDVCLTALLAENMMAQVAAGGYLPAYQREMAVDDIAYRMEKRGLLIDVEYTGNLLQEWDLEMSVLLSELDALGVSNPRAAQQVAQAMQMTEGWEPVEYTPSGQIKMDDKVLQGIDSDITRRVVRYRRLLKWSKAYLRSFLSMRDGADRVHPNFKPLRARTGRWSITGPGLQTLPRGPEIRNCIIPDPGNKILAIDYDGVEARVFTHFSGEERLLKAFREGFDVHTYTASEAYQIPMDQVTKAQRQTAKNVTFAKLYGAGPAKIANTAGISEDEARDFLRRYDAAFPGVPKFMDQVDAIGRQRLAETGTAYVMSWGGRRIPCDDDKTYALVNFLIQGSSADILKHVMLELDAAGYLPLMPVHDELLFDLPEKEFEHCRREIQEIMTLPDTFLVPLTTHASQPQSRWGTEDTNA